MHRLRVSLAILGLFLGLVTAITYAQSRPYFKAFGADVFTGGWFGSNPADPCVQGSEISYQRGSDATGGIIAFTKTDAGGTQQGGASSQLGVFSLGSIDGAFGTNTGFASGAPANPADRLSFANTVPDDFGGRFDGGVQPKFCITNYYEPGTKKTNLAQTFDTAAVLDVSGRNGQFWGNTTSPTPVVIDKWQNPGVTMTIQPGAELTVFVKGNVYIGANIEYDSGATVTSVPKFALVVRGSIFIGPNVTRLDGWYIAQPDLAISDPMASETGNIWTCHANSDQPPDGAYLNGNCRQKLTINGALTAKQVHLVRASGDLLGAGPSEDGDSANIAEVINYTPAMVLGGPFFNQSPSTSLKIQSLTSLPPVF
jgi:hypothetical protein